MLKATVEEAAQAFKVTPKTILAWVTEGMPTVKRGRSGRGHRTLIDMARATGWLAQRNGARAPITECFTDNDMPPNPLRWVAQRAFSAAVHATGTAAHDWATTPRTDGQLAWKKYGLTETQARALAFEWAMLSALMVFSLRDLVFETKWIEPNTKGANLDDFASLLLGGDVRSKWDEAKYGPPECLEPFYADFTKLKGA